MTLYSCSEQVWDTKCVHGFYHRVGKVNNLLLVKEITSIQEKVKFITRLLWQKKETILPGLGCKCKRQRICINISVGIPESCEIGTKYKEDKPKPIVIFFLGYII